MYTIKTKNFPKSLISINSRIIGKPAEHEWPEKVPLSWSAFPFRHQVPLNKVIPNLSDLGFDLLTNMLIFDPNKRLTAAQALQHSYFSENNE